MAQDGAQAARKGQAFFFVDRNLQYAGQLVFHRVFDGDNFFGAGVDLGNGCIQRGGLAAAGGAGHQHHAVGLGCQAAQYGSDLFVKAQAGELQALHLVRQRLLVQNPQHRVLAVDAGDDGDAQVNQSALQADAKAPVLGHSALGNIELRHHLDARDGLLGQIGSGYGAHRAEHAVHAVLDDHAAAARLQVDVAGAGAQGIENGGVDELDDGACVFADGAKAQFLHGPVAPAGSARILGFQRLHGAQPCLLARQVGRDVAAVGQAFGVAKIQRGIGPLAQLGVEWVRHHQQQGVCIVAQQQALVAQHVAKRHLLQRRLQGVDGCHGQHRQAHALAQCVQKLQVIELQDLLQRLHHGQVFDLGQVLCLLHQAHEFGRGGRCFVVHRILPASSKIGKYITTTMKPMTSPMKAISSGSNSLTNQSIHWLISLS